MTDEREEECLVAHQQSSNLLSIWSLLASAHTACARPIRSQSRNWYLGHSAAGPDELGYCFDFPLGKTSGMEQPAQKPAWANALSEVATSALASDWSGSSCRGKEGVSTRQIRALDGRRGKRARRSSCGK